MAVKTTVNANLTAAYQNVVTLAGGANGLIPIGNSGGTANKVLVTILTNNADIAWSATTPLPGLTGHKLNTEDSITINGMNEIKNAWLRNTVGASVAVAVITAFEVHE